MAEISPNLFQGKSFEPNIPTNIPKYPNKYPQISQQIYPQILGFFVAVSFWCLGISRPFPLRKALVMTELTDTLGSVAQSLQLEEPLVRTP